jgi:serine phosphatase RsbU (regulator of sigma subunit)
MSEPIHQGPIDDPGAALAVVAAAMERLGVTADERPGFLAAVAGALRDHHPGARLTLTVTGEPLLRATVGGGRGPDRTITAPIAGDPGGSGERGPDSSGATALLDLVVDQHDTLGWHRRELDQTNQGVLALHAELAETTERLREASDLQRRLLDAERTARAAAEASRARLAFLAHAGATLAESLDHEQILARLRAIVVPRHASAMTVWLVREPGVLDPFPREEEQEPRRPHPLVEKAFASGRAQHATREPGEEMVTAVDTTHDRQQLLAVPLISRGSTLGVLEAEPPSGSFAAEDVAVFTELARLTAVATDNALRYEHEHDVAQLLQRAMLTRLPSGGRLELTARYLPAEAGLNVGGDWYDAFERPDGDMMAVVGDVTGHGLQAAALMGQLRTTLRAYAMDAGGPGEVLTRMHRLLSHLQPDDLATAVLAQVSPDGLLRWANAGHPPPLVRALDGTVTALEGHDFLLGMPLEGAALREFGVRPEPGSIVLFYTDGLIERRGVPLGDCIDRLARAFGRAAGGLDAIADQVLAEMLHDSAREDDTCLLMFRATPP